MLLRAGQPTQWLPFSVLVLLSMALLALNLTQGVADLQGALWPWSPGQGSQILWELRMPRALVALLSGALLGVTGATAQALFRNPLADPSLIGISAGSALAAVAAIVLGGTVVAYGSFIHAFALPLASFIGGVLVTVLVIGLASRVPGLSMSGILLVGLAINAVATAFIGLLRYLSDDRALRESSYWLLGYFGQSSWWQVLLLLSAGMIILFGLRSRLQELNLWLLGPEQAQLLGVDARRLKWRLVLIMTLGVGVVVAFAGLIGFVGLMVPHIVRLWTGPDHRKLMPQAALAGGALMLLADTLARTLIMPAELPVGILTALAGGPFFLALIYFKHRETGYV